VIKLKLSDSDILTFSDCNDYNPKEHIMKKMISIEIRNASLIDELEMKCIQLEQQIAALDRKYAGILNITD
jgi:hypothetical protein